MKKIICLTLIFCMLAPSLVMADFSTATKVYTDEIFNGEPMYLMEERFTAASRAIPDANARPSGWDIDYRGGNISSDYIGVFTLSDISKTESITMSKKVMKHEKGKITFETGFTPYDFKSGFVIKVLGEGKSVASFRTEDDKVVFVQPDGKTVKMGSYLDFPDFSIKAVIDFDTKIIELYANGIYITNVSFSDPDCVCLDEVWIETPKETSFDVSMRYVYLYINYIENETFIGVPENHIPSDWKLEQGADKSSVVREMKSSDYPDHNSMNLFDESISDRFTFSKKFETQEDKFITEWQMLAARMSGSVSFNLMSGDVNAFNITIDSEDINFANHSSYSYKQNLWYRVKVVADTKNKTADVYLNQKLKAEDVPFERNVKFIDGLKIESTYKTVCNLWFDDFMLYKPWELPDDYVPTPEKVDSEYLIGMQVCSLWREGTHFGWDRLAPFEERRPYLGYYTEGNPEVADWEIKWLVESGVDYQIYCWYRGPGAVHNSPIKDSHLSPALNEGFLNAKYSNMMDFAIMWENSSHCGGMEDFTENIVPYWVEYYFKDSRYLVIDNKPVVGVFQPNEFIKNFGSLESAKKAIAYLRQACKDAGFDDAIVFIQTHAESKNNIDMYKELGADYFYAYGWMKDSYPAQKQITGIEVDWNKCEDSFIPNVSMGFNRGPWVSSESGGALSPDEMAEVFDYIKDRYDSAENSGQNVERMLMLGCWNEFGEGHWFMPSEYEGFGYMNLIRDKFTNSGVKTDFERPTEEALARLEVLYPQNRRTLKMLVEPPFTMEFSEMGTMEKWDFSKIGDFNKWQVEKQIDNFRWENGEARGYASDLDPSMVSNDINVDLSELKAIKINAAFEKATAAQLYYTTLKSPNWAEDKNVNFTTVPGEEYQEYIIDLGESKLYGQGNLEGDFMTALRLDPGRSDTGNFAIKSVELIGFGHETVKVYIDDKLYTPVSEPVLVDGVSYVEGEMLLYTIGGNPMWDNESKSFTVEYKDKKLVLNADSKAAKYNGEQIELTNAPYYSGGKFMLPLREVCEKLGVTVGWDNENYAIKITTPNEVIPASVAKEIAKRVPYSWEFNVDADTENWAATGMISRFSVTDGVLKITSTGVDPIMGISGLEIPAEDYRYIKIGYRNLTPSVIMDLFFTTDVNTSFSETNKYRVSIVPSSVNYNEVVIDTSTVPGWQGTITKLRLDPGNAEGAFNIDYIRCVGEEE